MAAKIKLVDASIKKVRSQYSNGGITKVRATLIFDWPNGDESSAACGRSREEH